MPTSSSSRITPISPSVRSTSSPSPTRPSTDGPIEDAGDDLADHGRHADALGDLGGQLGGDEDDEDVEEDCGDVHRRSAGRVLAVVQTERRAGRAGQLPTLPSTQLVGRELSVSSVSCGSAARCSDSRRASIVETWNSG